MCVSRFIIMISVLDSIVASATLAAGELSNTHVIRCHVMWIMCLLASSFWEGSSSLMEARDGSLESVSKTLSVFR